MAPVRGGVVSGGRYALRGLPIDGPTVRLVAVQAEVDPRSVIAELRAQLGEGRPVRGMAGHRIRRVLRRHGLLPFENAGGAQ